MARSASLISASASPSNRSVAASAQPRLVAQACRLPYDLVSDCQTVDLGDRRYLLSPQESRRPRCVSAISSLGVAALKIEAAQVPNTWPTHARLPPGPGRRHREASSMPPPPLRLGNGFLARLYPGWFRRIQNRISPMHASAPSGACFSPRYACRQQQRLT